MATPLSASDAKPRSAAGNNADALLHDAQDTFIRRWGEMGQVWGINRTMAELHALLYVTGQPLCTG